VSSCKLRASFDRNVKVSSTYLVWFRVPIRCQVQSAGQFQACLRVRMRDVVDSRWQSVGVIATFVGHDVEHSLGQIVRCNEDLL